MVHVIVNCIFCKDSDILMKMTKKVAESLEDKRKMSIFATSTRGIRRKDDNLYGLQRSFRAPNITSHHSPEWWLCCLLRFLLWQAAKGLRDGDTILHQILVGTLQAHRQLHLPIFHDEKFLELLLVPRVPLGWLLECTAEPTPLCSLFLLQR